MLLCITMKEEKNPFYFDQKTQGTKKRFNLTPYLVHLIHKIECKKLLLESFYSDPFKLQRLETLMTPGNKNVQAIVCEVVLRVCFLSWSKIWVLLIHFLFHPVPPVTHYQHSEDIIQGEKQNMQTRDEVFSSLLHNVPSRDYHDLGISSSTEVFELVFLFLYLLLT